MNSRKTTTVIRPRPAALLTALTALTFLGPGNTQARTQAGPDTPLTVTSFNRDQIENQTLNARNIEDLARTQPGLTADTYGGQLGTNRINLRGIDTNTRLGTGYYIDGVPVTGLGRTPTGLYLDPNQIERVEVLRGPQGTLFGRNNTAGVINMETRGQNTNAEYPVVNEYTRGYDLSTGYSLENTRIGTNLRYNQDALETGLGKANNPVTDTPITTASAGNTTVNTSGKKPCPKGQGNNTATNAGAPATIDTTTGLPTAMPAGNYEGYRSPCPEVDWDAVRNQQAQDSRQDAAWTANSLMYASQPRPFFDLNYHNTAADELVARDAIGSQLAQNVAVNNGVNALAQGLTVTNDPVTKNEPNTPEYYYRVAGGGDYTLISNDETTSTKTELPPIPEYKTTVRPINPAEMGDKELESEVKYGPGLIEAYEREAKNERDLAKEYREWAEKRRAQAKKARASAEEARKKAKDPNRRESSRKFWEEQAEAYDGHAEILEDSAELNDHSAKNADAVAERYEQDAQQTKVNLGWATGEYANRQGQRAVKAAQAQAARDAEAARLEAQRQRELDEMLRQSQQNQQNNSSTNNQNSRQAGSKREYRPDGREPRIGREPRKETLRKLGL